MKRPCFICRILYGHEHPRCLAESARVQFGTFIPVDVATAMLVMEGRRIGVLDPNHGAR